MQQALERLGYKSYHMSEAYRNKAFDYWLEALKAKYDGQGRSYQREEFDKLLGDYAAVTDAPCFFFVDELIAAYPDAKVILTSRDEDSWLLSMNKTILQLQRWKSYDIIARLEPNITGPFWKTLNYTISIQRGNNFKDLEGLRQTYREHNAHVRKVVPRTNLLEFRPGDGYKELCHFLDEPLPGKEPYPHSNRHDENIKLHKKIWWFAVAKVVAKVGGLVGAIFTAAGGLWYSQYRIRT
ncbi:MAG: hypothetical protein Q9191_001442 [Dirinaria sp. TL-2023a]